MKTQIQIKLQKFSLSPVMSIATHELINFKNPTVNSKLQTINSHKNFKTMKTNPEIKIYNLLGKELYAFPVKRGLSTISCLHKYISSTQILSILFLNSKMTLSLPAYYYVTIMLPLCFYYNFTYS